MKTSPGRWPHRGRVPISRVGGDSEADEGMGKRFMEEQGRPTGSGASCVTGRGTYLTFSSWSSEVTLKVSEAGPS